MASVVLREYLTYIGGGSRKHYFVWIREDVNFEVWTAWGSIGANPQVKMVGAYSTNLQARRNADVIIKGKVSKGYIHAQLPTNFVGTPNVPVPPTWETGNIQDSLGAQPPVPKFAPRAPLRTLPPKKTDAEKMAEVMSTRVSKWGF